MDQRDSTRHRRVMVPSRPQAPAGKLTPLRLLAWMGRTSRGSRGRLLFFVACLAVGVAAVVAVAGLSEGLRQTLRTDARQLLAADLAVTGHRPIPAAAGEVLRSAGATLCVVEEMPTMAAAPGSSSAPGASALVEVKAAAEGYPFYGTLELAPPLPLARLLAPDTVVVAPELLPRLGLTVGDEILLGGLPFRITGIVRKEPDRVGGGFQLGPRVFLSPAGLERAGLVRFGSRVDYRLLARLPDLEPRRLGALAERVRQGLSGVGWHVETYTDAQPNVRWGIRRAERFVGLIALVSLLVGGVGMAQTVRAWIAGRLDAVAVLRCLGVTPREIVALYLGQAVLLGIVGSLLGAAAGLAVEALLPRLLAGLLPLAPLSVWQPAALLRGVGLGFGTALLFGGPPLLAVHRLPPVRVLRRDVEPPPPSRPARLVTALLLAVGIGSAATAQADSLRLGAEFTAGVVAAAGLLAAAARLIAAGAGRLRRDRGRIWLRHGLAALARPGGGTVTAIVALGLGALLVTGMTLVEEGLTDELTAHLPHDAPSVFLVDVQPDQRQGVERLLAAHGATHVTSVPVVSARLVAIDDRPVGELTRPGSAGTERRSDRRWAATREQRLTYLRRLPADNRIVAGCLWCRPEAEVSVEEGFAEDLGIGVGDHLRFDIQGVRIDLVVSSLRTVDWRTFGINFFLVVEPGVLDDAPQSRLATALLPPGGEQTVQDALAHAFPNVTVIRVREILDKVKAVLETIGTGVRFLGGFTVAAGIVILAGAVAAGSVQRAREVALLKTLGFRRREIAAMFATEYALLGLVAGGIGVAGACLLSWAVLEHGMEITWRFRPWILLGALGANALLAVAAGLAASRRALERRPMETLREE